MFNSTGQTNSSFIFFFGKTFSVPMKSQLFKSNSLVYTNLEQNQLTQLVTTAPGQQLSRNWLKAALKASRQLHYYETSQQWPQTEEVTKQQKFPAGKLKQLETKGPHKLPSNPTGQLWNQAVNFAWTKTMLPEIAALSTIVQCSGSQVRGRKRRREPAHQEVAGYPSNWLNCALGTARQHSSRLQR